MIRNLCTDIKGHFAENRQKYWANIHVIIIIIMSKFMVKKIMWRILVILWFHHCRIAQHLEIYLSTWMYPISLPVKNTLIFFFFFLEELWAIPSYTCILHHLSLITNFIKTEIWHFIPINFHICEQSYAYFCFVYTIPREI